MSKTLTLRVDEKTYGIFKKAAERERRNISNFIENATYEYIEKEKYVSDIEMEEVKKSSAKIRRAVDEVKKGKYKIVK